MQIVYKPIQPLCSLDKTTKLLKGFTEHEQTADNISFFLFEKHKQPFCFPQLLFVRTLASNRIIGSMHIYRIWKKKKKIHISMIYSNLTTKVHPTKTWHLALTTIGASLQKDTTTCSWRRYLVMRHEATSSPSLVDGSNENLQEKLLA